MGFSPTVYVRLASDTGVMQLCAVTNGFSQSSEVEVFCPTEYSWEKKGVIMKRHRKLPRAWAIQSVSLHSWHPLAHTDSLSGEMAAGPKLHFI